MERRLDILCVGVKLFLAHDARFPDRTHNRPLVADSLDDVASSSLALCANERSTFGDATERLAEVTRTTDKGHLERVRVDVVFIVGGGEHLRLIDVVDSDRLENLSGSGSINDAELWNNRIYTRTCASTKWPMRTFAITGIVTASTISLIILGSLYN